MQLKIDNLTNIVTKTGKNLLLVKSNGTTYSCFPNATTAAWRVGMTIDVETERVEKDGKTYWNIKFPKQDHANSAPSGATMDALKRIETKLDLILKTMAKTSLTVPSCPSGDMTDPFEDVPFPDAP